MPKQQRSILSIAKIIGVLSILVVTASCSLHRQARLLQYSKTGDARSVARLIKDGVDVNEKNHEGVSALIVASAFCRGEVASLLLQNGSMPDTKNVNGVTPLLISAAKCDPEIAFLLLKAGADPDIETSTTFKLEDGLTVYKGTAPLLAAADTGRMETVRLLMENGANINKGNSAGVTPLIAAAAEKHADVVETLIAHGAELNRKSTIGFKIRGKMSYKGSSALLAAADAGDLKSVTLLVKNGADVNIKTENGITALMAAAAKDHYQIVKILLDNGADVNAETTQDYVIDGKKVLEGSTALMAAAYYGRLEILRILLDRGANVHARDKIYGCDALYIALMGKNAEIVKLLLDNGADIHTDNKLGQSAISIAKYLESEEIETLIQNARKAKKE